MSETKTYWDELSQAVAKDQAKVAKEIYDEISEDVTDNDALDPVGLKYYILNIYQEFHTELATRNTLLKHLSQKSGVSLRDLKDLYAKEARITSNEASRSTPLPKKYSQDSITILQLLASPNREVVLDGHEKLTRLFLDNHYVVTTRNDKTNEVWIYEDGIYVPNGVSYVKEFCRMILGAAYESRMVEKVLAKVEADTFVEEEVFFNQQNKYPYLIPVKNGLLDVREKRISPFDPKRYFFNKVNAVFEPSRDCPLIKDFFHDTLGSEKDVEGLREFIGYCLVKHYKHHKSLLLEGDGSNGKTTVIKLISEFLGSANVSNVNLNSISQERFSMANLHNKLANLVPDISSLDIMDAANFKSLTGSDPVEADRKFKSSIRFVNYAKMIFGANKIPIPKEDQDAFFRRWIIVKFPFKFVPASEIGEYNDRGKVKVRDDDLLDKVLLEGELSGFLNWVIDGYSQVLSNGDFTNTQSMHDVKVQWTRMSNSFAAFSMDMLEDTEEDVMVLKSDVHRAYTQYCKEHRLKVMGNRRVNSYMEIERGAYETRVRLLDGDRPYVWVGLKFKDGSVVSREEHKFSVLDYKTGDGMVQKVVSDLAEEDVLSLSEFVGRFDDGDGVSISFCLLKGYTEEELSAALKCGSLFEVRSGVVKRVD